MVEDTKSRLHAIIEGRVQGVGFRYFVMEHAISLELTGWVRNRWDGTVEVIAEGKKEALEQLLRALQRGPRSAFVNKVKFTWQTYTGGFSNFRIKLTA